MLPERLYVVFYLFFAMALCSMDRVNISVAIIPMAAEQNWSESINGLIQSSFFWGFMTTQIPGGYFAHKLGGKFVLAMAVALWSLMTIFTPLASKLSMAVLLITRVVLGFAEGVSIPAIYQIVSKWVPSAETARALSLIHSGMYLGSVSGLFLCPVLINSFGWPSVFYAFGALGLLWALFFELTVSPTPIHSTTISDEEQEYILHTKQVTEDFAHTRIGLSTYEKYPLSKLLRYSQVWALNICHFCATWTYFINVTWMPTYFNKALKFDLSSSALYSILPWITMFLFSNASGYLCDYLVTHSSLGLTKTRKIMQAIGFLGPAIFLLALSFCSIPSLAVVLLTFALAFSSFSLSGLYSTHQDIGPNCAGVLFGISNTFGALAGVVGVAVTGIILDKFKSWTVIFALAIFFNLLGTAVFTMFASSEQIFE